jgi:hypothetical protein
MIEMNAVDILMYGHRTVLHTLEGVPVDQWGVGGVCGVWSTKDIIAHLASYEQLLIEVLSSFVGEAGETPYSSRLGELGPMAFNDYEVDQRKGEDSQGIMKEYQNAYVRVDELAKRIPAETWRKVGTLPWYGPEYSLDDLVVYQYYGHKREHTSQINVFQDQLTRK